MKDSSIEKMLGDIASEVSKSPAGEGKGAVKLRRENPRSSSQSADKDQRTRELIDYLRLNIKYVLFDLESTRRENKYLRCLLENRGD